MKKYLFTIFLGTFGLMILAAPALAVTNVSFTPVSVSVSPGQTFTLTIGVNPQGVKNYTAKTELRYPADLLEARSFTFASSWLPLAQPGYDLTDNANGVLIKTAGYPGGASAAITFGTVSFYAKKSGSGTIALNGANSLALDANNQNVLAGASVQTAVAISVSAPAPITPTTPAAETVETGAGLGEEEVPIAQETDATQPVESSLLAAVGNVVTLGTNNIVVGLLVTIIILALVGYAIYVVIQKARRRSLGK